MKKNILWLGAAAIAAVLSPPAQAALSSTGVSCSGQSTTMTSLAGYMDCSGAWAGNNLNQSADVAAQIAADWGLSGLVGTDVTGGNSGSTGTLNFGTQSGIFVLALKAGDAFSLYEFNAAGIPGGLSSINFDTLGVGFFSGPDNKNEHFGQGLSHAEIYAPVPEPATVALMLAGVGLLWTTRRRARR
jgi:hypothetical protein